MNPNSSVSILYFNDFHIKIQQFQYLVVNFIPKYTSLHDKIDFPVKVHPTPRLIPEFHAESESGIKIDVAEDPGQDLLLPLALGRRTRNKAPESPMYSFKEILTARPTARPTDGIWTQLDGIWNQVDGMWEQFDGICHQFDGIWAQFNGMWAQFDGI